LFEAAAGTARAADSVGVVLNFAFLQVESFNSARSKAVAVSPVCP
jgi:hypothetical protein